MNKVNTKRIILVLSCSEDTKALAVEVVGYWMEVEILSLTYDRPNMMIKILPGRTDPQLPKKGNITAKIIEELVILRSSGFLIFL